MKAVKKFVVISASLLMLLAGNSPRLQADTIPGVFSTGVDNFGTPLSVGTTDPHYTLVASPSGPVAAITTTVHPLWVSNTLQSAWINMSGAGTDIALAGTYEYVLTFSLAGFNPATVLINGEWASDNDSIIVLNGMDMGFSNLAGSFNALTPFQLNNGFVAGVNQLKFIVNNPATELPDQPNPTGLQVHVLNATAVVPEPSTIALVSLFGLALAGVRRCCAAKL